MKYRLDESWRDIKSVVVYGFGRNAHGEIDYLLEDIGVEFIIDNNPRHAGKSYRSVPIYALAKCLERLAGKKIVILAIGKAEASIRESLSVHGFTYGKDFCDVKTFISEWHLRFRNMICLPQVLQRVTLRCTLNCAKCSAFIPYIADKKDMGLEMLKTDLDALLSKVDHIVNLRILGGEPFIYAHLGGYIDYIGRTYYPQRVSCIQIITNGNAVIRPEWLASLREYRVHVRISDYTDAVPYHARLNQFIHTLTEQGIIYDVVKQMEWLDFGFPEQDVDMGDTPKKLQAHMQACHNMCQAVYNGRCYYCSVALDAFMCGRFPQGENDWLDMKQASGREILDYFNGNVKNGYLQFCRRCRGFGKDNGCTVKAGVQKQPV